MSGVSGVLLAAAVVDASGLAKTVARSKRGLWTLVPPAGSQFLEATVDALSWAVGGPGPARHFARTGLDLASANLLCQVWTVQISPDGDPGPVGGGPMAASLLHSFSQVLTETLPFTPPAAPKNAYFPFDNPSSAGYANPYSSMVGSVSNVVPVDFLGQLRLIGFDTSYPVAGGTPAGYGDVRVIYTPGAHPAPYPTLGNPIAVGATVLVYQPFTHPGLPSIKYSVWWAPSAFGVHSAANTPDAPNSGAIHSWTAISPPGGGVTGGTGGNAGPALYTLYQTWGLRYDEAADETVWVLEKRVTPMWSWFSTIPCTVSVRIGGVYRPQAATVQSRGIAITQLGSFNPSLFGIRVRRNGIVGYDDLAGPVVFSASEAAFPSLGQTFTLGSPISATCPSLGFTPGLVPNACARAGGDFAVLYQDPVALTAALVTSTGNKGTLPLPVPSGGRVAYRLVEITERGGRLYLMRLL